MWKIVTDALIMIAVVVVMVYLYQTYWDEIVVHFYGEQTPTMFVESTPIAVHIADSEEERKQGLSGTDPLSEFEGMLFVFDREDYYGMWMKDMNYPLDIIWIDNDYTIVHIEKNISPDTYPTSFGPPTPARFVLETSAFFTENANVIVGDAVTLPPSVIPQDLVDRALQ